MHRFFDNCKAPCRGTGTDRKPLGPICSNNIIHGPVNKLTSRKMWYIINVVIKDGERRSDGYERRLLSWQCHPRCGTQTPSWIRPRDPDILSVWCRADSISDVSTPAGREEHVKHTHRDTESYKKQAFERSTTQLRLRSISKKHLGCKLFRFCSILNVLLRDYF